MNTEKRENPEERTIFDELYHFLLNKYNNGEEVLFIIQSNGFISCNCEFVMDNVSIEAAAICIYNENFAFHIEENNLITYIEDEDGACYEIESHGIVLTVSI